MIKVLMFDWGGTLIDAQQRPFAHVHDALAVIAQLETASGKPLRSCLVCDVALAAPQPTPARVGALFAQFLARLDASGLRSFFEPVVKRVTLSVHAGAMLPERTVFDKALRRLGVVAALDECLLVSADAAHVQAARQRLHMYALQFGPRRAAADFDDWAVAPALIAHAVAPDRAANLNAVVRAHLAGQGVELVAARALPRAATIDAVGQVWWPVSVPGCDDLEGLRVAMPVTSRISRGPRGTLGAAPVVGPSSAELAEAGAFVRSLAAQGQIAGRVGPQVPHPTHRIETDAQGVKRLVRVRYSAV